MAGDGSAPLGKFSLEASNLGDEPIAVELDRLWVNQANSMSLKVVKDDLLRRHRDPCRNAAAGALTATASEKDSVINSACQRFFIKDSQERPAIDDRPIQRNVALILPRGGQPNPRLDEFPKILGVHED